MNAIDRPGATTTGANSTGTRPRIFYADPTRAADPQDVDAMLEEALSLGFNAVLIPPPWLPAEDGNRFVPASLDRLHPTLGADYLTRFLAGCRARGLQPMLDVVVGHVAASFETDALVFEPASAPHNLDPRGLTQPKLRRARADADVGAWWARRVEGWANLGIAGLRLLGLESVDAASVIVAIRGVAPSLTLIGWTPGLAPAVLPALHGVDYVVSSLPWWDRSAPWLLEEIARLRAVAPVLSCPEVPFDERVAASVSDPAVIPASLRRSAGLAAAFGDGWIVPAGFATGARRRFDVRGEIKAAGDMQANIGSDIEVLNRLLASPFAAAGEQMLASLGGPLVAVLRTEGADARFAASSQLHLVNTDPVHSVVIDPAALLANIDGSFDPFTPYDGGPALAPGTTVTLEPGEYRLYAAARRTMVTDSPLIAATVQPFAAGPRVAIESPAPCVDDGAHAAKRIVGEVIAVSADVICDGHDALSAVLHWRGPGETAWTETPMRSLGNDRFGANLPLERIGAYEYTIEAWRDVFATYRYELEKKVEAGLDVSLEIREGVNLVTRTASRVPALQTVFENLIASAPPEQQAILLSPDLATQMAAADDRPRAATLPCTVRIDAERSGAAFAAWYEVFPRSMSDDPNRHGTFADVERHLPRVRAMGFDVLYFPPIHPIGRTNRKGANNTLTPSATDPGSPYAIGSAEGGHDALHPELGSFEDFHHLIDAAAAHGLEIAIDFAIHPLCREPTEEIPGHRQRRFLRSGRDPRVVGGARRNRIVLVPPRHPTVPRGQSPHKALPVLAVDDCGSAQPLPGCGVPGGGVYPAESHVSPSQSRFQPELQLFHLAGIQAGDGGLSHRIVRPWTARVFPPAFLRQHAGHQPSLSAGRAALGLRDSRCACGDVVRPVGRL
jgi:starch synthase (maltosyl-transferring)